ncbi:unnamed protein product [Calypogeia fissa]
MTSMAVCNVYFDSSTTIRFMAVSNVCFDCRTRISIRRVGSRTRVRSSLKVAYRPGDGVAAVGPNSVQSLGQILKNVEDMEKPKESASSPSPVKEQEASASSPDDEEVLKEAPKPPIRAPMAPSPPAPAPPRKPSVASPPSRPAAQARPPPRSSATQWRPSNPNSGGPTPAQREAGVEVKRESGPRDLIQSFRPDANFRAQARTQQTTRPKPAADSGNGNGVDGENRSAAVRKGPILRDVGAPPRRPGGASSSSGGPANANSSSAGGAAAPKFTKNAPVKGKEDWRKKQTSSVSDGARRRVAAREKDDADAAVDLDSPIVGKGLARPRARKQTKASRKAVKAEAARAAAPVKVDILEVGKEGMSVADLAAKLAVNDGEVVKTLFLKGIATMVNQTLDEETVRLVCNEFEVEVVEAGTIKVEDMAKKTTEFLDEEDLEYLEVRPPVVTIMGHVDHGKTSLLDYIRKSKVAAGEAGGITQGIGAYRVLVQVGDEKQDCVFLDTPGHQAFSAMRARGARVTDIAVIVVAADDGVRPQSIEAIAHAKAAGVPFVVAINKMDKEGAQPERVMQELSSHGVMVEDWGGDVPAVQVSAKVGTGVESLLDTIMLIAEIQELRANPDRSAKGTVIEARLDKTRGTVATLLVQNGTLRKGDVVLCGESYGKVRAMTDDTGAVVEEAGPSTAVQVTGLGNVPTAGDEFEIMESIDEARDLAAERALALRKQRLTAQAGEGKVTLASLGSALGGEDAAATEHHMLNVVLKVDVQGSVEAIREALQELPQNTVGLRFLMQSVGEVSASDIDLATASEAVVIGFNVNIQPSILAMAEKQGVEVRTYDVIYELLDDMRKAMEGMLDVVEEEIPLGQAEVRAVFGSGSSRVAGCMVTEGKLTKDCGLKVMRKGSAVYTGVLDSLRRVKELAKEVVAGLECGVGVEEFTEWQEGDIIEAFTKVEKRRSLEEASITTVTANARSSAA